MLIANHRSPLEKVRQRYGNAHILDVTSHGPEPWRRFSPFYPHGGIPVPFSPGQVSASVEGIWQGLKVFQSMDVDTSTFAITKMKGIKRSARKYGDVLGHRAGVNGDLLLSYVEARYQIYLPSYRWVLEHCLQDSLALMKDLERERTVILLDYETNSDVENITRPLSHAALIQFYVEGTWPTR